jgi:putative transposase
MILIIGNSGRAMRAPTISSVINQFKGYATKQIGFSIWQKPVFEYIIRDKEDYQIRWNYIDTNLKQAYCLRYGLKDRSI